MKKILMLLMLTLLLPMMVLGDGDTATIRVVDGEFVGTLNPGPGDKTSIEFKKTPGGGLTLKLSTMWHTSQVPELKINRLPIQYKDKVIGGITEVKKETNLYVGALHLFKDRQSDLSDATKLELSTRIPILVKKDSDEFFDIVIFIDRHLLATLKDSYQLRSFLQESLSASEVVEDGRSWVSPHQFGKQGAETGSQNSHGRIAKVVPDNVISPRYHQYYLENSATNFSSKASSGSIIYDSENATPLGVLQCQMNKNLVVDGNEQNTKGLYRILAFDILNQFEIQQLDSNYELFEIANQLVEDPDCDFRGDGKGGGGNEKPVTETLAP